MRSNNAAVPRNELQCRLSRMPFPRINGEDGLLNSAAHAEQWQVPLPLEHALMLGTGGAPPRHRVEVWQAGHVPTEMPIAAHIPK